MLLMLFVVVLFSSCSIENSSLYIERANILAKLFDVHGNYTIQIIPDAKSGYSERALMYLFGMLPIQEILN